MNRGATSHEILQFHDVLRKGFCRPVEVLAQRPLQFRPGPWRATQTQIDTPRKECVERPELFGNLEGGVIGQHDPARTDADTLRRISDMRQNHGSRTAGNALHRVVFRHPIAFAARFLGPLRQGDGGLEAFGESAAFADRDEIEDGICGHSGEGFLSWSR